MQELSQLSEDKLRSSGKKDYYKVLLAMFSIITVKRLFIYRFWTMTLLVSEEEIAALACFATHVSRVKCAKCSLSDSTNRLRVHQWLWFCSVIYSLMASVWLHVTLVEASYKSSVVHRLEFRKPTFLPFTPPVSQPFHISSPLNKYCYSLFA